MKEHTIDASDRALGRVASEAAVLLMGKDTPEFRRNVVPAVKVTITNAAKVRSNAKKMKNTIYQSYSGYPGGLKEETMEKVVDKKGHGELFRKAVYGMLPGNKLRDVMMKNLTVTE